MNAADRLLAWATGTLAAFGVAAFVAVWIVWPAFAAVAGLLGRLSAGH